MKEGIELRDAIAIEVMKEATRLWYSDMKGGDRERMVRDWVTNYGDVTVAYAISRRSYEFADDMLSAREVKSGKE